MEVISTYLLQDLNSSLSSSVNNDTSCISVEGFAGRHNCTQVSVRFLREPALISRLTDVSDHIENDRYDVGLSSSENISDLGRWRLIE